MVKIRLKLLLDKHYSELIYEAGKIMFVDISNAFFRVTFEY